MPLAPGTTPGRTRSSRSLGFQVKGLRDVQEGNSIEGVGFGLGAAATHG